jgi:hypothetical protein
MSIENPTLVHFRHFSSLLTIFPSTTVVRALQIHPFLTNKANFQKSQVNISDLIIREYELMDTWSSGKKQSQTKPKQTQFKANTNPKQTQNKANQSQFWRQKMTAAATNRKTWKIKTDYSTIALQSVKTMYEETNE